MGKRWVIRGFFLALLLLWLVGWAWSYGHRDRVTCYTGKGWAGTLGCGRSMLYMAYWKDSQSEHWTVEHSVVEPTHQCVVPTGPLYVLGFAFERIMIPGSWEKVQFVGIPFWFPTLILALCSGLVWRITRKRAARGAFSGEMPPTGALVTGPAPGGAIQILEYASAPPRASRMAVGSMIIGLVAIPAAFVMVGPLLGLVAFILGSIARHAISKDPKQLGGLGFATAGIVLGMCSSVLGALVLAAIL